VYLSKLASKVYLIHRRDKFRAEKILQDKAFSIPAIEILRSHVLKEIQGSKNVTSATVEDLKTSVRKTLDVEGVFIGQYVIPFWLIFSQTDLTGWVCNGGAHVAHGFVAEPCHLADGTP